MLESVLFRNNTPIVTSVLHPRNFCAAALLVLLIATATDRPAFAQTSQEERTLTDEFLRQMDRSRGRSAPTIPASAMAPLEGAVNPSEYIVGPNDIFTVSIGGALPIQMPVPVSADGRLVLPDAGSIHAGGRTLAEVKAESEQALRRFYRNVSIDVSLAQPRQFYVHITGSVPKPGRYLATPVARIESLIYNAFGETAFERIERSDSRFRPSLRNIEIRRQDGTRRSIDLKRYYATGDTDYNPYLRDGDVIFISSFRPDRDAVYVGGEILNAGFFELRPDDGLADVLTLAVGPQALASVQQVRVTRREADGSIRTTSVSMSDVLAGRDNPVRLQPRDNIFVDEVQPFAGSVKVEGMVRYPGAYPVQDGSTTLRDVIEMAGGLLPEALPRAAYLERGGRTRDRPEFDLAMVENLDLQELAEQVPREVLQNMRLADLDLSGRLFLMREMQLQNRVAVNVAEVAEGSAGDVPVFDGDRLVVPPDQRSVMVLGQVVRPGFVAFEPGASAAEYVRRTGGTGPLASETWVIEAGTGRWIPARASTVESGDIIFVSRSGGYAETAELQQLALMEESSRRDARFRTASTILATVGTITSLLTTYLLITRD